MNRLHIAAILTATLLTCSVPTAAASWGVFVGVLPSPMHANEPHAELLVKSRPGAVCRARVAYDGVRQKSTVFPVLTIRSKASAIWKWHNRTHARRAEATIRCTYGKVTLTSVAYITIKG